MIRKKCVIIDSDQNFARQVAFIIESSNRFIVQSIHSTFDDSLKKGGALKASIILMDISYPIEETIRFITHLSSRNYRLEIIILSNCAEQHIITKLLTSGATGYLLKSNCLNQLLNSLAIHDEGNSVVDPSVLRDMIKDMHLSRQSPLTYRETEIMTKMVFGKNSTEIARECGISAHTSKKHIKNIYKKLNVRCKSEAVETAINEKLIRIDRF